ncbi:SUKH-3 domain-containing protein [Streptomyces sp. NPDC002926]
MEHSDGLLPAGSAVSSALMSAGWHRGRRVDASAWVDTLEAAGFEVHDLARLLWEEFGGLLIRSSKERDPGSSLRVDPVDACIDSLSESARLRENYGEVFSPLGMWSIQYRSYVSASGRVLAIGPGLEWELGRNFGEALEFVVCGGHEARIVRRL